LKQVLSGTVLQVVPASPVSTAAADWAMVRTPGGVRLVAVAAAGRTDALAEFEGEWSEADGRPVLVAPPTAHNAAALRRHLPWLAPQSLPAGTSAGFGDRLGLATPGHVQALRAAGGSITPVFAQQSIREMTRTGRAPQAVMDDATWGCFEAGWTGGQGADADHLKTAADITACAAAGFTMFTIDPGEHVDPRADTASPADLRAAWDALPWERLEDSAPSMRARLAGRTFDVEAHHVLLDEGALMKAAVKYGRAIAHVTTMFRHLCEVKSGQPFDLEVSVDETDTPTTPAEHAFVASELGRLGVRHVRADHQEEQEEEHHVEQRHDVAGHRALGGGGIDAGHGRPPSRPGAAPSQRIVSRTDESCRAPGSSRSGESSAISASRAAIESVSNSRPWIE